ncbi:MAG: hypothetical protein H0S79_16665 [Anaerolineaceae bacterium]|nr:hypothetical protein [Anaerolineaceae bacterium]
MHNKKVLYKSMGFIVMLALLLAASPLNLVSAAAADAQSALQSGGDRLVALQQDDGGWDWPLDDGNTANASPVNTLGPIAKGLAEAYNETGDAAQLAALADAGGLLLTKVNNFSPSDGYLAAALDEIFGGTTYRDHVVTYFYDVLAAGSYDRNGAGTLYDTAGYINLIRTIRSGDYANMAAWDIGMGLVGAASCGADTTAWIDGVKTEIDELDSAKYYDVLGLAGAVYGLAFVGEDFDPTAGSHAAASTLADLADILASYQIDLGGFSWSSAYVIPDDYNEEIQETAYAVLALNEMGRSAYLSNIVGAADYMMSVQLATGGWENYVGSSSGENNEITGEALWAIAVAYDFPMEVWVCETGDCGHPDLEFDTIQEAVDNVAEGGTVHVAAGTYAENVVVDKPVSIIGAGSSSIVTSPVSFDSKVGIFQITGSGLVGSPILLQDLQIEPVGQAGISVGRFTEATGTHVSYLSLENVAVIGTNNNPSTEQERGLYVDLTSTLDHLVINNSAFNNLTYGWYFQKQVSADASTVSNVQVTNTSFNHNNHKGIYAEKLSDATFTNCVVSENGYDVSILPSYFAPWSAGVDINLKAGTYQNLSFIGMTITDNAIGGSKEGVGITVKARDDGSTYGAFPASVANVLIQDSFISGNERGVRIGEPGKDNASPTNVVLENNQILGNTQHYVGTDGTAYGDVINQSLAPVDASPNWWGSMGGPLDSQIAGDVEFVKWCGDEGCTFLLPDENNVITLSGTINVPGGIEINQPGLTIFLEDGVVIQNDSPCFIINADYTTITTESPLGAVCLPTNGSNAIDVNDDRTNIVIEGLEIDGADGANGIDFDGVVTDLVIRDTYIHGLAGDGLFFGYQPEGIVQIQGNLFMGNGGNGIEAGAFVIPAEFNSWGAYAGPETANGGDGISAGVDADPWTYVDLYLEDSGTDYPGSVYLGEQITFEVRANLVNAMGVDFVLDIPAEYTVDSAVAGSLFDNEYLDPITGGYHFHAYQIGSAALTGEDLVLFTVTLEGAAAGKPLTLNLDEMTDVFSMAPGYGPSTNIYASELSDYTNAEVNAFPTMDIVPSGAYIAGLPIEFSVDIDNADGDDFASVGLSFTLPAEAILEYWDGTAWVEVTGNPFMLGALAGDAAPSLPFRVLFVAPGSNVVSVDLHDLTPDPDTLLATASETFLTLGNFNVTGTISMQGRSVRSGVPMKLASLTEPYYPDNDIFSTNEISNNILFAGVNGGLYNISTAQPRYLNIPATMGRTLDITGDIVLPDLELKGGNADWSDNVIDISDAGIVGGQYGTGGLADNGDVNFDDRVNIQDLALVGGNFDLTSEEAYVGWPGFTEVSGTFVIDEGTGLFSADMTGAKSLHIEGQGLPAGTNLTSFTGTVTGDITGTIAGMINAQGKDILYAVITPASGDPVRLYGTLLGDFEGWLVSGPERNPVGVAEITGPATVEVGDSITLEVLLDGDPADRPVLWAVYVNHSAIAEIDMHTGELTGLSAGTATVIVTVLDDGNVSFDTYSVTVTAP